MSDTHSNLHYKLAVASLFLIPGVWCANYLVARAAATMVPPIPPHGLAISRWFIAGLLMLALTHKEIRAQWPLVKREWKDFLLLGAFGMWICGAIVYMGGQTTSALNMGLIYASSPVFVTLASAIWLGERLRWPQYIGVALSLAGVLYVITKGNFAALANVKFVPGDGWILLASLSWTAYSILLKQRKSVLSPAARLTCITFGGVLVLTPFTVIEMATVGTIPLNGMSILMIAIVAIGPGFMAYQAFSFMQGVLGAARSSLVLYLAPIYTALFAWLLLNEAPGLFHLIGGAMVIGGMAIATKRST
jgi:drug/metabolite transporter (DMT)-like permease